jgi:hypothetical protein
MNNIKRVAYPVRGLSVDTGRVSHACTRCRNPTPLHGHQAILATGGLNDPRVAYWEPAKWVAMLREHKTDQNALLLKIDLTSGHGGSSDR